MVVVLVAKSCLTLCDPTDHSLPDSFVYGDSPDKNTGVGCHALLQGNLPNPGIEPRSPELQAHSLPFELVTGKTLSVDEYQDSLKCLLELVT